jgi:hypothetical protein
MPVCAARRVGAFGVSSDKGIPDDTLNEGRFFMEEDDAESGAHTQEQFPLSESELRFIQNISHLIRSQLPRITPQNLRGAAILLLALERLPIITVGVVVEATFRQFDVTPGNFGWADLRLSDEELTLGIGEHFL